MGSSFRYPQYHPDIGVKVLAAVSGDFQQFPRMVRIGIALCRSGQLRAVDIRSYGSPDIPERPEDRVYLTGLDRSSDGGGISCLSAYSGLAVFPGGVLSSIHDITRHYRSNLASDPASQGTG